jgi:hypothetical protein
VIVVLDPIGACPTPVQDTARRSRIAPRILHEVSTPQRHVAIPSAGARLADLRHVERHRKCDHEIDQRDDRDAVIVRYTTPVRAVRSPVMVSALGEVSASEQDPSSRM